MTAKQEKRRRQREARKRKSAEAIVTGNRVLLEAPVRPRPRGPDEDQGEAVLAWMERGEREARRDIYPVVRLREDGPDWGAAPGAGDLVGYAMHPWRNDMCLAAAIATTTQIAIEEVPDPHLDRRLDKGEDPEDIGRTYWQQIEAWAESRSLVMEWWEEIPVPRDPWIAVSSGLDDEHLKEESPFIDHCLVMSGDRILFDPSCSLALPPGTEIKKHDLSSIEYGLSFEKEE